MALTILPRSSDRASAYRAPAYRATLLGVLSLSLAPARRSNSLNPWSGKTEELQIKEDPTTVPVEELYNRGVDALNGKNYAVAVAQFDLVEQNYPVLDLGGERAAHAGLRRVPAQPVHRRDRRAGPLHPAAPGAPRHRLCLLPAGALLLRADRRHPARPEGHAGGDGRAAGSGEPLPRQRLWRATRG